MKFGLALGRLNPGFFVDVTVEADDSAHHVTVEQVIRALRSHLGEPAT